MSSKYALQIPNTKIFIHPNDVVKLGRFDTEEWIVKYGWFSFGGNRPWCGWHLISNNSIEERIKPLLLTDLEDIYFIEN